MFKFCVDYSTKELKSQDKKPFYLYFGTNSSPVMRKCIDTSKYKENISNVSMSGLRFPFS